MSPLSPIQSREDGVAQPRRALRMPLDPLLTLAVVGLSLFSIETLGQTTQTLVEGDPRYFVKRQTIYLVLGFVLMLGASRIDYTRLRRHRNLIYGLLMVSILAVLGLGHAALGSQRAINLPLFSFQGSELGKVLLIVSLSAFVVDRARYIGERDTTARVMLAALIPAMIVIAQPDLGSGMVYMVIAIATLFIAGTRWKHLAALAALVVVAVAFVLIAAPAAGVHLLKPYQTDRLTAFLDPGSKNEQTYQLQEAKIAIGSGGKTGAANPTQVKLNFVPEHDTDFVFAATAETYGFAGAGLVLLLYALLIWRTLQIIVMSKDLFGSLIAAGVAAMLMFQVFVNVGMTVGIMPITGVTLPLMSYGGSSVITTMLAVGLLQSIYVQARAAAALKGRVLR